MITDHLHLLLTAQYHPSTRVIRTVQPFQMVPWEDREDHCSDSSHAVTPNAATEKPSLTGRNTAGLLAEVQAGGVYLPVHIY